MEREVLKLKESKQNQTFMSDDQYREALRNFAGRQEQMANKFETDTVIETTLEKTE